MVAILNCIIFKILLVILRISVTKLCVIIWCKCDVLLRIFCSQGRITNTRARTQVHNQPSLLGRLIIRNKLTSSAAL